MVRIAVTQRVVVSSPHGERRDALDQRWAPLLDAAGLTPIPVPNSLDDPIRWAKALDVDGVLLTGGNDLVAVGGDAPERDAVETALVDWAIAGDHPLVGVCRGMQLIQHRFGVALGPVDGHVATTHDLVVDGHVATTHDLVVDGRRRQVNSFHGWAATTTVPELEVCARAADGVIEAVRHVDRRIVGIMWHPERSSPTDAADVEMLARHFGVSR